MKKVKGGGTHIQKLEKEIHLTPESVLLGNSPAETFRIRDAAHTTWNSD